MDKPLAAEIVANERADLVLASDAALAAIHEFADYLQKRLDTMPAFRPMGGENYEYMLRRIYLQPIDAAQLAMLGEV